jgi:DNA topoisomerase-2
MSGKSVDVEDFPKSARYQPICKVNNFKIMKTKNKNDVLIFVSFSDDLTIDEVVETLRLQTTISLSNLTAFNRKCEINQYTLEQILLEFFITRHNLYIRRKDYLLDELYKEINILENKVRFIEEIMNETIIINKVPINKVCKELEEHDYDKQDDKYEYLYKMSISKFTNEEYTKLTNKLNDKNKEKDELENKTVGDMWLYDLSLLEKVL